MYNIGLAFHTACLLLHFTPVLSASDFSTPAFFALPHFQSPSRHYVICSTECDQQSVITKCDQWRPRLRMHALRLKAII